MYKIKPTRTYRQVTHEQIDPSTPEQSPVNVLGLIASSRRSTSCTILGSCRLVQCLRSGSKLQLFSTSGSKLKSAPVLKTKHAYLPQFFHAPPESQPTVNLPQKQSTVQYLYIKSLKKLRRGLRLFTSSDPFFIQSV